MLPLAAILFTTSCGNRERQGLSEAPNIILIITDDQGYGDVGIHGNPFIKTPVMDSLAGLSTRIDPFYVCPVCAPTRSSLMTGRYHLRTGVYDTYNGGAMMAPGEVTLAEVLSGNGYHTAMIGKWHLGDSYPMRPMDQGFQYYLAHKGGGIGQPGDDFGNFIRTDSSYFDPFLWENGKRVRKAGYCSDVFTDQAISYIREQSGAERPPPFFLYLSYNAPHTPLQLPHHYYERYSELEYGAVDLPGSGMNVAGMRPRDMEDARKVYGMVSNLDDNLGRLWGAVRELGIEEQTLIVFLTDNGPQQRRYNGGLNNRKGSVLEGGIRVPCWLYWKGTLEQKVLTRFSGAHIDLMPTLLELAGISYEGEMDGISLAPMIRGGDPPMAERPLFFVWARGYPQKYDNMAVRKGDFKLVGHTGHGASPEALKLFNLAEDPAETSDASAQYPDVKQLLLGELDRWYGEVIRSPNLEDPPRIIIGSDVEDPVILGRNDWKGPSARQWQSADAFGYWDVEVTGPGPFDVTLVYSQPVREKGRVFVRAGTSQYWISNADTAASVLTIPGVTFIQGDLRFEAWYEAGGRIYTPIYIQILQAVRRPVR